MNNTAPSDETAISPRVIRPVEWVVTEGLVEYGEAVTAMEDLVRKVAGGTHLERIWLLEHPSLYTAGTSAKPHDLLNPHTLPVYDTGRGGQFTYHGPGQRVVYVMLDVKSRFGGDVRAFTSSIEQWVISALSSLGLAGFTIAGQTGVWVDRKDGLGARAPAKIAAIGLRIRHGISFHGVSINVDPELTHYAGIVPCGIAGGAVTSLADLSRKVVMNDVDQTLRSAFPSSMRAALRD